VPVGSDPLILAPLPKPRAWGGDRLVRLGKVDPAEAARRPYGESWEVADLPPEIAEGVSRVVRGGFAGRSLRELIERDPAGLLGRLARDGRFPLLVKYLDAGENLSVQVHPSPGYARHHPDARLKSEAWVVLHAEPGAAVYRGLRPGVGTDEFLADLSGAALVPKLARLEVARGDCVYLPSGIPHALGAGLLVAEVQTPSDTTFRIFDWDRGDPARPLHVEEARACLRDGPADDRTPALLRRGDAPCLDAGGFRTRLLCRSPRFAIEAIEAPHGGTLPLVTDGVPIVVMSIGPARAAFVRGDEALPLMPGETAILPAALAGWSLRCEPGVEFLRAAPGSELDRAIAGAMA